MKPLLFVFHLLVIAPAILGRPLGLTLADMSEPAGWSALPLGQAMGYLVLFGAAGSLLTMVGCRLFNDCTRAELHREQGVNKADPADRHEG